MRGCPGGGLRLVAAPASWRSERRFVAQPDQVSSARAFVAAVLAGSPLVDDAVLICSELASNALLHSESRRDGGEFVVRVEQHIGDYLWIEVEDQGGLWAGQAATDESGRGLHIVSALAEEWGIEGDAQARVVWGRLTWPAGEAQQ